MLVPSTRFFEGSSGLVPMPWQSRPSSLLYDVSQAGPRRGWRRSARCSRDFPVSTSRTERAVPWSTSDAAHLLMNSAGNVRAAAATGEILRDLVRWATGGVATSMGTTLGGGAADLVRCAMGSSAWMLGATLGGRMCTLGGAAGGRVVGILGWSSAKDG